MKAFEIITGRILAALDEGVIPWRRPWTCGGAPRNLITGKPYRGLNVFLTVMQGYASPYWLTFKQAQEKSGQVRKGEKGTPVVYWNYVSRAMESDSGEVEERQVPFMRYYTVFNLAQIEGIIVPEDQGDDFAAILSCEDVITNMPQAPVIESGWAKASYNPATDVVRMPPKSAFRSEAGYYSTLFHELTHSTGHTSRLDRKTITEKAGFASESYSKEELIAELGAAFLCGHTGIEQETIENSAAYVAAWRSRLSEDKRLIISAAAQAQKAADFILDCKAEQTAIEKGAV